MLFASRLAGGFVVLLLLATPALAHLSLRSSTPDKDARLSAVPRELRLQFTAAADPGLARLSLDGPAGSVPLGQLRQGPDDTVIEAPIQGKLAAGTYVVRWQVAGPDGHPVRGEFSFVVEESAAGVAGGSTIESGASSPDPGPSAPGQAAPPPEHHLGTQTAGGFDAESPLYAAVRWLTFAGLLAGIGAVSFALLLLPAVRRREQIPEEVLDRARARAASVGLLATGFLVVALILRLLAQSAALHGPSVALVGEFTGPMLLRTLWGWGWSLQAGATGLLLVGLWLARKRQGGGWILAAVAVLGLAVTPALSGHAAATSAVAVVADTFHVLAAGGWLGTLLFLLLVGLPVLHQTAESRTGVAASLLAAFSPLALVFAGVVTVTGVYAAWAHIPDLGALWTSAYGRTLLVKLATLSVVFARGAYNWRRAGPALEASGDPAPLRRSATAELATGALVLAITAVLVATPPPVEDPAVAAYSPDGGGAPTSAAVPP